VIAVIIATSNTSSSASGHVILTLCGNENDERLSILRITDCLQRELLSSGGLRVSIWGMERERYANVSAHCWGGWCAHVTTTGGRTTTDGRTDGQHTLNSAIVGYNCHFVSVRLGTFGCLGWVGGWVAYRMGYGCPWCWGGNSHILPHTRAERTDRPRVQQLRYATLRYHFCLAMTDWSLGGRAIIAPINNGRSEAREAKC
jgi:hypothetical protein